MRVLKFIILSALMLHTSDCIIAQSFNKSLIEVIDTSKEKYSVLEFIKAFYQCPDASMLDEYIYLPAFKVPETIYVISDYIVLTYGSDVSFFEDRARNRLFDSYRSDMQKFYSLYGKPNATNEFFDTFHGWSDDEVDAYIRDSPFRDPRHCFAIEYANKNRYRAARDSNISADEFFFRDTHRISVYRQWVYDFYQLPMIISNIQGEIVIRASPSAISVDNASYTVPVLNVYVYPMYKRYSIIRYSGKYKLIDIGSI